MSQGLIHSERIVTILQLLDRCEPGRCWQRAFSVLRSMAVRTHAIVNFLPAFEGLLVQVAQHLCVGDPVLIFWQWRELSHAGRRLQLCSTLWAQLGDLQYIFGEIIELLLASQLRNEPFGHHGLLGLRNRLQRISLKLLNSLWFRWVAKFHELFVLCDQDPRYDLVVFCQNRNGRVTFSNRLGGLQDRVQQMFRFRLLIPLRQIWT